MNKDSEIEALRMFTITTKDILEGKLQVSKALYEKLSKKVIENTIVFFREIEIPVLENTIQIEVFCEAK